MNLYNKHKSRNKLPCKLPIYYAYFALNSFKGRETDSWRTCLHLHLCISAKVTRGEERWEKDKKNKEKTKNLIKYKAEGDEAFLRDKEWKNIPKIPQSEKEI